ncbi:SDR family NAD(P)-dependent oxidoreductase [Piscinibacter terrae]|uniref:SDR family oxidoreductase n=1 Tax=Piscinibacter terrae TaxID=2496871 RepID=A0A3N7HSN6_9BURK|nr:SDR family oxidoreductase [Albitalea terrae]RQP24773.1 SDR family oxidoreductase [Albitalea terrae]
MATRKSSKPVQGLTALVTGASSGIGESLARCFAADGHDLVLVARSADKLQTLAEKLGGEHGVRVTVLPADLSKPDAAKKLRTALQRKKIAIDVLVNNAGVLDHGAFTGIAAEKHQALIDLNISGLTAMLAHFLPAMIERGRGRILNVASIASFQPVPSLATYAASKAFVLSLTESLAEELKGTGVTVTALCPGITATGMLTGATDSNPHLANLPGFVVGDVDAVAAEGYKACMNGEVIKVPGAVNLAAILAARASPKWIVRKITGSVFRKAL